MSQTAWEALSNQAVAAAGVVYFLALLSHLAEWALLRSVPFADLDRKLDFKLTAPGGASDERHWDAAFRHGEDGGGLSHLPLGSGHYVLARADADVKELVS